MPSPCATSHATDDIEPRRRFVQLTPGYLTQGDVVRLPDGRFGLVQSVDGSWPFTVPVTVRRFDFFASPQVSGEAFTVVFDNDVPVGVHLACQGGDSLRAQVEVLTGERDAALGMVDQLRSEPARHLHAVSL